MDIGELPEHRTWAIVPIRSGSHADLHACAATLSHCQDRVISTTSRCALRQAELQTIAIALAEAPNHHLAFKTTASMTKTGLHDTSSRNVAPLDPAGFEVLANIRLLMNSRRHRGLATIFEESADCDALEATLRLLLNIDAPTQAPQKKKRARETAPLPQRCDHLAVTMKKCCADESISRKALLTECKADTVKLDALHRSITVMHNSELQHQRILQAHAKSLLRIFQEAISLAARLERVNRSSLMEDGLHEARGIAQHFHAVLCYQRQQELLEQLRVEYAFRHTQLLQQMADRRAAIEQTEEADLTRIAWKVAISLRDIAGGLNHYNRDFPQQPLAFDTIVTGLSTLNVNDGVLVAWRWPGDAEVIQWRGRVHSINAASAQVLYSEHLADGVWCDFVDEFGEAVCEYGNLPQQSDARFFEVLQILHIRDSDWQRMKRPDDPDSPKPKSRTARNKKAIAGDMNNTGKKVAPKASRSRDPEKTPASEEPKAPKAGKKNSAKAAKRAAEPPAGKGKLGKIQEIAPTVTSISTALVVRQTPGPLVESTRPILNKTAPSAASGIIAEILTASGPYATLSCSGKAVTGASLPRDIKRAYNALCLLLHPDSTSLTDNRMACEALIKVKECFIAICSKRERTPESQESEGPPSKTLAITWSGKIFGDQRSRKSSKGRRLDSKPD